MKFTKVLFVLTFLSVSTALATPGQTQARAVPSTIASGMVVNDTAGGVVGTVQTIEGDYLIIETDKHKAKLPKASFTLSDGALLFGLTQAQLDASIEAELAEAAKKIVAGASVIGSAGTVAGTIDSVDKDLFTLKLTTGELVRLPLNAVVPSEKGLMLGITADQLQAAVSAARQGTKGR